MSTKGSEPGDFVQQRLARPLESSELRGAQILRGVSTESVWGILQHCPVLELASGELVIAPDQSERALYVILSGALEVHLDASLGERVALLKAGQAVGEISVLEQRSATAYVVTTGDTRLLAVSEAIFWRLIQASHEFAINLLLLLAGRMRENNRQLFESVAKARVLEREVTTDALTGLFNRRWLDQRLPRLIDRHVRSERELSLLLIDVDHFKRVNDRHGHAMGDAVLSFVARTLLACVRPTDLSARYGGEELVVILPDTPAPGASVAGERVRAAIAKSAAPHGEPLTVSVGVSTLLPGESAVELLKRADERLYAAKAAGRNRVEA